MIIGITGSIGCGKTTVSNLFRKYGFEVINVDKFYAELYARNKILRKNISREFGTADRTKIKKIVFSNPDKLRKLNRITHPVIIDEIKRSIKKTKNYNKHARIIIDAPLLLESEAKSLVDRIVVVRCNESTQITRVLKKKKYTKQEIRNIIKSQMPLNEKLKLADFVVDNTRSLNETKKQVSSIIKKL